MKKIGILTFYHGSRNYGGNLQAYALCRYLRGLGYDAEQICFTRAPARLSSKTPSSLLRSLRYRSKRLPGQLAAAFLKRRLRCRAVAFAGFNREIPHSETVYTQYTVQDCDGYDIYIAGSDQIWNPSWMMPSYFLDFVPPGKPKLSYAASLGCHTLKAEEAAAIRELLAGFSAVSVREQDAVELLAPLSPVAVEWVLDPTLLLSPGEWDEVCEERRIEGPYVFCYFLGESLENRRLAAAFARGRGLTLVCLPYLQGAFRKCDLGFGDTRLYDVTPGGFLSLIKHAAFVLTDSFHAAVFSELYRKDCAALPRGNGEGMESRLYSLLSLFQDVPRFCDTEEKRTPAYLESLPPMDPDRPLPALEALRKRSREFLMENLTCQERSTPCETPPMAPPEN